MNADQLLRDTFVDHEHLAPDADDTLRRIHSRVDGRATLGLRRRPFLVVATGVGVAATIAVIVTASVIIKADDKPVGPTLPANHSTQPGPSIATTSHAGPTTAAPVDYLTIAAEYLPPGTATQVLAENGILGQQRNYVINDGATSTKVDLTSAPTAAGLPGSTTFTGPGTSLRIAGFSARQWTVKGRSRVVVTRSNGVVAVDVTRTAMPTGTIAALTRKVSGQLAYDRHDSLKPEFRLGSVPAGLQIGQLLVDNRRATTWLLTATAADGSAPLGANTQVYSTDAAPALGGPAGRSVQGHATWTGTKDGVPVLEIVGAVGQHTVVVSGGPWAMSLSVLYKIGDGLALS